MNEKELNVEAIEAVESEEVVEETKKSGFISKSKAFVKKNGKKLAAGAGARAIGLIGVAIGKGLAYSESYEDYEDEDLETCDEDSDVSDDTTEATEA